MSDEYLTDDEQLEQVKRLAREYGPPVLGAVLLAAVFLLGTRLYQDHRTQRALAADAQFAQLMAALAGEDHAATQRLAEGLIKEFPDSPYADQAKLTLARLAVDEGQDAKAVVPLADVVAHSKDAELRHIARLRLARVQIDAGQPDEALKALSDAPGAFAADYHEVRGDAYLAKKDTTHALEEYRAALGSEPDGGGRSALLTLKIADLGVPPLPPAAALMSPALSKAKP
jgi:predicted negative regulator of RcsB-dependent stress response